MPTYTDQDITEAGQKALNYLPYSIRRSIDVNKVKFVQKKSTNSKDIAAVDPSDPNTIYVQNVNDFMNPDYTRQLVAHEATHLMQAQVSPEVRKKFPSTSSTKPYDYGDEQNLMSARSKGKTMEDFSIEQQGAIVQQYAALMTGMDKLRAAGKLTPQVQHQYEKQLSVYQPYIDDYEKMPLQPYTSLGSAPRTPGLPTNVTGLAPFEHTMILMDTGASNMPIDPALSAQPQSSAQPQVSPNAGAAATMGSEQPPQQLNPNTGSMVAVYLAAKQAKVAAATSEFDRNMKAQSAGFPIDPTKMGKLMKKMGLHPIEDPHEMAAWWQAQQGQKQSQGGAGPTTGGQAGPTGQPQGSSQPQPPNFDKMSKKDRQKFIVDQMGHHALSIANTQGQSAQQQAEYQAKIQQNQTNALSDDPEVRQKAIGNLMAAGKLKLDLTQAEFASADPAHRKSMINVAAGYESHEETTQRAQGLSNTLMSTGKVSDPVAAQQIGTLLANGQPIPLDLRSKMKPQTFHEMSDQADLANKYIEMGVGASRAMAMAQGGITTLPKGVIPIVSQQLALQQRQVDIQAENAATNRAGLGIEQEKVQIEVARYQKESAAMDKAAANAQSKQTLENFKNLVYMKQAGMPIPKDYFNSMLQQAAEASGLTVSDVHHWWGTTTKAFNVTPDTSTANAGAGAPTTAPSSSVVQSIQKGVKKIQKVRNEVTQGQTD